MPLSRAATNRTVSARRRMVSWFGTVTIGNRQGGKHVARGQGSRCVTRDNPPFGIDACGGRESSRAVRQKFFRTFFHALGQISQYLEIRPAGEPEKYFKNFSKRRLTLRDYLAISPSPSMGTESIGSRSFHRQPGEQQGQNLPAPRAPGRIAQRFLKS